MDRIMNTLVLTALKEFEYPYRCLVVCRNWEVALGRAGDFYEKCTGIGLVCTKPSMRNCQVSVGSKTFTFVSASFRKEQVAGTFIDEYHSTEPLDWDVEMFLKSRNPNR